MHLLLTDIVLFNASLDVKCDYTSTYFILSLGKIHTALDRRVSSCVRGLWLVVLLTVVILLENSCLGMKEHIHTVYVWCEKIHMYWRSRTFGKYCVHRKCKNLHILSLLNLDQWKINNFKLTDIDLTTHRPCTIEASGSVGYMYIHGSRDVLLWVFCSSTGQGSVKGVCVHPP